MTRTALAVLVALVGALTPPALLAQSGGKVSLDTVHFAPALDVDLAASKRVAGGLFTRDLIVGDGRFASRGDEITVRYVGTLADGRRFTPPTDTATFKLGAGAVIEGWDRGLTGMRVGGRRQLVIAPDFGYRGKQAGAVPPNSVLVFELELLSVR